MQLIDVDSLIEWLTKADGFIFRNCENCLRRKYLSDGACVRCVVRRAISNAPIIDPEKHGHWIKYYGEECGLVKCSCCGHEYIDYLECDTYCGNCGAKMDEQGGTNETN